MAQTKRFKDENLLLSNFDNKAQAVFPACAKKQLQK